MSGSDVVFKICSCADLKIVRDDVADQIVSIIDVRGLRDDEVEMLVKAINERTDKEFNVVKVVSRKVIACVLSACARELDVSSLKPLIDDLIGKLRELKLDDVLKEVRRRKRKQTRGSRSKRS